MKKKLSVFLAVFAAVSLFAFAACNNSSAYDDSALTDRIESLEDQIAQQEETIKNQTAAISALQNSVTELQTAKTKLEEQIASLEDGNSENKTEIQRWKPQTRTSNSNLPLWTPPPPCLRTTSPNSPPTTTALPPAFRTPRISKKLW